MPSSASWPNTEVINLPWPGHAGGRTFKNYNTLLPKVSWVNGIKTGYTTEAGWCLIGSATKNGVTLVSSVLGDVLRNDVDPDTLALFNYGFAKYKDVTLGKKGVKMAEVGVPYYYGQTMPLVTDGAVRCSMFVEDATTTAVMVTEETDSSGGAGYGHGQGGVQSSRQTGGRGEPRHYQSLRRADLGHQVRVLLGQVRRVAEADGLMTVPL